ncbi:hypothetical protein HZS_4527 [Henneguya salminicola]|nr:hypothetical protein HZS_4527 [Henneguya salminicola]
MARFAELYDKLKNVDPKLTFMDSTFTDYDELLFSTKTKHAMEFLSFFMQSYMCIQLEAFEPECKFKIDRWYKSGDSGGGVSCILQNGKVIEKGGVNVSVITGDLSNENAAQMRSRGYKITNFNSKFNAVGIS